MSKFDKLAPWQIISERDEINNRFLRVRNVTFKLPNNQIMTDYFIAEKTPVAIIVPIKKGKTYLIKEWERGVNEVGHKFPAGRVDPGEEVKDGAARELKEELGLEAHDLTFLGEAYVDPGFMTTLVYYFLCTDFTDNSHELKEDPFELFEGEWVDFLSIEAMIYANEIKNPYVIIGYFLAKNELT
jgi:8-oxo-dGTP pyrophosphatase MutT (NUDIX family)